MKASVLSIALGLLCACGGEVELSSDEVEVDHSALSVSDAIEPVIMNTTSPARASQSDAPAVASEPETASSGYWGVVPGEPLSLKWDDLLPQAAEEEYLRQQAEFFAALEQKYAQNARPFSEANTATESIDEGSVLDVMPQFGTFDVVEEFDGQLVRIPGYVVPLDFNSQQRLAEFLFVPYMGACLHTPPPPPNQIIFVQAETAVRVKDIWVPYWAEGKLQTEQKRNGMGDAAYTLNLEKLEPYNFE